MFIIVTVLLFTYYAYRLFNPINNRKYGLFFKQFEGDDEEVTKEKMNKMTTKELRDFKNQVVRKLTGLIGILIQQVAEFLYLILALKHDPLKYPTIAMLLWWIIALAISKKKSIDDVLAKVDTPKYKRKKKLIAIIDVVYFGYMFIVVVKQYF